MKEWKVTKYEFKHPKVKTTKLKDIEADTAQDVIKQMKKINKIDLSSYNISFENYDTEIICYSKDNAMIMLLPQYMLEQK